MGLSSDPADPSCGWPRGRPARLHESGALTDEEFTAAKARAGPLSDDREGRSCP
ncbi:MAG TPA: SHOCT domain-containing protein [Actinomycetota bacterium]|nr:SHOCT domain-containing protein [Actinomycetota bacterium]